MLHILSWDFDPVFQAQAQRMLLPQASPLPAPLRVPAFGARSTPAPVAKVLRRQAVSTRLVLFLAVSTRPVLFLPIKYQIELRERGGETRAAALKVPQWGEGPREAKEFSRGVCGGLACRAALVQAAWQSTSAKT